MVTKATSAAQRQAEMGGIRIVATNAAYSAICRKSLKRLPSRARGRFGLHTFSNLEDVRLPAAPTSRTVFVSSLADLPEGGAKEFRPAFGDSKHLLFLEELPVEAMPARLLHLGIRNPHRLHVAAAQSPQFVGEMIYRLCSGLADENSPPPIVDAWIEGEKLVLLSPAFERLAVPLAQLAKFLGKNAADIHAFEIDEDGRFLYWPHADVHLGWEQLQQMVDPASALAARQRSREFNRRYGAAIRKLREEQGLKQSEIPGVTERHLRRVEHGELAASTSVLKGLAEAHGWTLAEYLERLAKRTAESTAA